MTKRLVRFYVTQVHSCRWCPAVVRGVPFRCSKIASNGRVLPLSDAEAREIPDVNRIPRWCPLPKEER